MAEVVSLETVLRWKIKVVLKTGTTLCSNGPQTLNELIDRCGNEPILSLEDAYYSQYRHSGSWIKVRKKGKLREKGFKMLFCLNILF